MRRVLLIQPQFAPCSYPTAQRTRLFATHLAALGWEPIVFAATPESLEEPADPGFAALIPRDLRVVRFAACSPRFTRPFGLGDLGLRSLPALRRALRDFFKHETADAVIIHGPPWLCFTLGPWLRRRYGLPYLLDYIDPWIAAPEKPYPLRSKAFWYRRLAIHLEPKIVAQAAGLVAISDGALRDLHVRYPAAAHLPQRAIPYGFEPSDFAVFRTEPRELAPPANPRILAYVGARLPASIPLWKTFFAALRQLDDALPDLAARLRIRLLGTTYAVGQPAPLLLPLAATAGVAHLVEELPARLPYGEALDALRSADGLLVIGTTEPHYAASKIFPTLAAGKPLLGAVHAQSEVVPLLRAAEVSDVATFTSTADISDLGPTLRAQLEAFFAGELSAPDAARAASALAPYTAAAMTARLAALLDEVTASPPPPPSPHSP